MKFENEDTKDVREALQEAFPPGGAELRRDLWPLMLQRLDQAGEQRVAWYDWALAAVVTAMIVFFPKLLLLFAYQL